MPPSLYTDIQTSSPSRREESSHGLSLSVEIIHHKNAPLLESSEKINPCGVIRLKSLKSSFILLFLETQLDAWFSHQIRPTSLSGNFYLG